MTPGEKKLQSDAAAWVKRYESLCYSFDDNEAREYAEEMSQVAEGRKDATQKSPHDIRREMKLLTNIESMIVLVRGAVVVVLVLVPLCFQPAFLPDPSIARLAWLVAIWILAGVVGYRPFW